VRQRGLEDVLHYFIPEEEQSAAREAGRPSQRRGVASASRWCLPASPGRPLSCAVAIDLAVATARSGCPSQILAPFPQHRLLPRADEIPWRLFELQDGDVGSLERALADTAPGSRCFVLLPPSEMASLLQHLEPGTLDGVLVPIDGTAQGPAQALALLRQLGRPLPELRIGAVVVGADAAQVAAEIFEKLKRAARRQLGLQIENLGEVRRDPASFRSLLYGVSVLDLDEESGSARSLLELCERLGALASPSG